MSPKPVQFHEGAAADVRSAVEWYRERNARAALEFIEELRRATETIRRAPERWPMGRNNARRFLLWRFPFSILYSEQDAVIMVWAVAHGSRRPDYWTGRLP